MSKVLRNALGGALALLLCGGLATAQEFRGRVQGAVTDSSGATVPGATLTLLNTGTNVAVTRASNAQGTYLFDYVDPGAYKLTAEISGFKTAVQENIRVQQRADISVNFKLEIGGLEETVVVTESPVAVQFTTASRDLTIESEMVKDLPSASRNPFGLAALDPTSINRGSTVETQPYHHRTANEADLGGGTKYRNDILLDGTPLTAGNKLGYTPPMDAVTEYTVQQNAVDAEFGHSAGGIALVTMKSGTNQVRGSAYYYGRNSDWNAMSDRALFKHNDNPYWNAGATLGMPLKKDKLFLFAVFERIRNTQTTAKTYTLPTALERQGDFSQSYNADGSLRVIYDPLTSVLKDGKMTRQPFPGNKIPANRFDPLAARIFDNLWMPNNVGDDKTGLNNFKYQEELQFHYYNFSTRLDWQINPNWKAFARVSRMKTDQTAPDYTDGNDPLKLRNITGSKRNGWNIAADTVYTLNPSTSLNLRGSFYQAEDKRDYPDMAIGEEGYANLWPNQWWDPYMEGRPLVYNPYLVVDGTARNQFGVQNFWYQQPNGWSAHARLNKYFDKHSVKLGSEIRFKRGEAARFYFSDLRFVTADTANVWASPNSKTGNAWASFLLGAVDPGTSNTRYNPMQIANTEMYAFYLQDDFRVTPNLTLNLGLRWEYEGGLWDPEYRLPQQLDLASPIPGMQDAIDAKIPAAIRAQMAKSAGQKGYSYTGAFSFTEEGNKRKTKAPKDGFMPRLGFAWRVDDQTALRGGYGRFIVPAALANSERDTLGAIDLSAFSPTTNVLGRLDGIPQAYLSNPFPQGLTPAYGKSYGRYTNLGDAVTIDQYEQEPVVSDRFNISVQRQLPGRIVADVTYFINFISNDQYNQNLNLPDPRLNYSMGADYGKATANPFYNYGTIATFPGALRRVANVPTSQLLRPYPQYYDIIQTGTALRSGRQQSLQLRFQRPLHRGFSFLVSYAMVKNRAQWFYDIQDEYDGTLTWFDFAVTQSGGAGNPTVASDPVHRLVAAATIEVPVGRDRAFGKEMPTALDAVVGGWQLSGTYTHTSGVPLIFGTMTAPASVNQIGEVGKDKLWFDTTGFKTQPAYTRRSNPWYYDGLNGPGFYNVDLSLLKQFRLTGRVKLQLRLEAFNALNHMNWANPILDVTKSDFGRTNTQFSGYYGRQFQYSARVEF